MRSIYRLFDFVHLYSGDADEHLRGLNELCEGYTDSNGYVITFSFLLSSIFIIYTLMYHTRKSSTRNTMKTWFIYALVLFTINLLFGFSLLFGAISNETYCLDLTLTNGDAISFGLINAFWSFIGFLILTSSPYPRKWSTHRRNIAPFKFNRTKSKKKDV